MSEIKPDVNKKVNQLREMDARDRWRLIGNWLLDHAMIIIILLMVIYIQIQRPAFLATASYRQHHPAHGDASAHCTWYCRRHHPHRHRPFGWPRGGTGRIRFGHPAAKVGSGQPLPGGYGPLAGRDRAGGGYGGRRHRGPGQRLLRGQVQAASLHCYAVHAADHLWPLPDAEQRGADLQSGCELYL